MAGGWPGIATGAKSVRMKKNMALLVERPELALRAHRHTVLRRGRSREHDRLPRLLAALPRRELDDHLRAVGRGRCEKERDDEKPDGQTLPDVASVAATSVIVSPSSSINR